MANMVSLLLSKVKDFDARLRLDGVTKFVCRISELGQWDQHIEGTKQIGVTRQADCFIVSWLV